MKFRVFIVLRGEIWYAKAEGDQQG